MKIEIKPAPRSNPNGDPDKPWNIWKDGRNTNVKPTKEDAERAAGIVTEVSAPADDVEAEFQMEDSYFNVPRPKGAPVIGTVIDYTFPDGETIVRGAVTAYLSTQFVIEYEVKNVPRNHVVRPDEDFKVVS